MTTKEINKARFGVEFPNSDHICQRCKEGWVSHWHWKCKDEQGGGINEADITPENVLRPINASLSYKTPFKMESPQMKKHYTIVDYLKCLPEPYRSASLSHRADEIARQGGYCNEYTVDSHQQAIGYAFTHSNYQDYNWSDIQNQVAQGKIKCSPVEYNATPFFSDKKLLLLRKSA